MATSISDTAKGGPSFDKIGGRIAAGIILAFGLLGGVGGWALTANLTGAVVAMGTVKVDQNLKQVQHRDGGIVAEIAVREGDDVAAGQVLFRLDDAQSRTELSILTAQLDEAEARRARLVTDRDNGADILFPARFTTDNPVHKELMDRENRLHTANLANRENQRQQLQLGIAQVQDEILAQEAQRAALVDELSLVERNHARVVELLKKGLVEAPRVEDAERELVQIKGRLGELAANIARSHSRISEIEMRILAVGEVALTESQRELVVIDSRIPELSDRISAVQNRLSLSEIRAPIAGRINEMTVFTEGGVITPAEILATIVPTSAELRVEVQLPVTAIDQVYLDQVARIKFSAFNHRTTPEIMGAIAHISPATTVSPQTGEAFYIANLQIAPAEMAKLDGLDLMPGMPVEVYLSTREQTAAAYLARPLMDQFERAFKEE